MASVAIIFVVRLLSKIMGSIVRFAVVTAAEPSPALEIALT